MVKIIQMELFKQNGIIEQKFTTCGMKQKSMAEKLFAKYQRCDDAV